MRLDANLGIARVHHPAVNDGHGDVEDLRHAKKLSDKVVSGQTLALL
jgi:hypothetical protein